jgi:hypothetical protein
MLRPSSSWEGGAIQAGAAVDRILAAGAPRGENNNNMPASYITLGQISGRLSVLEVACNRCDRRGRLNVDRLIAERGPQFPVPELRQVIAADCPRMIEGKISDPCGVHFPGLAG